MAVHTLSKFIGNAWTGLAVSGSYTVDLGIVRAGLTDETGEAVMITNGEAGDLVFKVGVGSNTGVIKIVTGNVADNQCIMIGDGIHAPDIYEFDYGDKASGIISVDDNPHAGDIVVISDGVHALNFEADGVGANVNFAVGVNATATLLNLKTAMNAIGAGFTVTAGAQAGAGPFTLALLNDDYGTVGNVAIDVTGAVSGHWAATTGMAGGLNAGSGAVTGTHFAVAKGATALASATNLVAEITAHAVGNYSAGTPYADPVTATTYCIPLICDSMTDRILMDTFGSNIAVTEDTTEYEQNEIEVQEVTGSYSAGWTRLQALCQKFSMVSIAGGSTGIFWVTKGTDGNAVAGPITAKIIVLPHLLAATTTIGAFTAATDSLMATGFVKSGR